MLRALGIDLTTDACCRELEPFELRTARGALIRALPGAAITAELGHPFVSIHRNELIRTLRNAAADAPIHYGAEVVDVGIERCGARATCVDGTDVRAGVLIGADGFRSAVRSMVAGEQAPSDYGYVCWLATVRLYAPAHGARIYRPLLGQRTAVRAYRHRWRDGLLVGNEEHALRQARDWNGDKADILSVFDGWAPEVVEAIERTPADAIISVPGQDRPFLKRWGKGPITLLGDAAHPMLTSRSQGASSAVEDGYVLAEAIARIPDPVEALRAYEDRRRDRARMLVRSSRRLNRVEQAQNPVACAARNLGLRCVPMRSLTRHTIRPMRFDLGWTA